MHNLSIFPFLPFRLDVINYFLLIDEKTREEFQLWMKAFPHLRVTGKKIEVPLKVRQINPVEFYEEIIAIDPPQLECDSFKLLDQELNEKLSLRKSSAKNQLKNDNLEKLLRITSSGISGRNNNHNHKPQSVRKYVDKTSTVIVKQNSNGSRLSKIQERDLEKLSYSASSRPILNVKFLFKKPESVVVLDQNPKVKSASSKLPLYELRSLDQPHKSHQEILATKSASLHTKNVNLIHLPPFNYDLDFQGIIQGRSIQSAFNGKKHV